MAFNKTNNKNSYNQNAFGSSKDASDGYQRFLEYLEESGYGKITQKKLLNGHLLKKDNSRDYKRF